MPDGASRLVEHIATIASQGTRPEPFEAGQVVASVGGSVRVRLAGSNAAIDAMPCIGLPALHRNDLVIVARTGGVDFVIGLAEGNGS